MTNASKDASIDYKEQSNQKQYSFVSFVMEPSKKNKKSMRLRDKSKPLIDQNVLNKQIRFMKKLLEYQKQNSTPIITDEFDETPDNKTSEKKKNKRNSNEA